MNDKKKMLKPSDFERLILKRTDLRGNAVVVKKGKRFCYQYEIYDKAGNLVHLFHSQSHSMVAVVLHRTSLTSFTIIPYTSIAKLEARFYKEHIDSKLLGEVAPGDHVYGIAYMSESDLPIYKILKVNHMNSK